jgi:hypothetical protein
MSTPNTDKPLKERLAAPFPAEDIEWRVGKMTQDQQSGLALAYLTNRAIMERLDEVVGVMNWRNEFREWKGHGQLCGISIRQNDEWITKWDGADDSDIESLKGGLSDAMKRAAVQWGIGRYLYKLPDVWVALEKKRIKVIPTLPAWALPDGATPTSKAVPPKVSSSDFVPPGIDKKALTKKIADTVGTDLHLKSLVDKHKAAYGAEKITDLSVEHLESLYLLLTEV